MTQRKACLALSLLFAHGASSQPLVSSVQVSVLSVQPSFSSAPFSWDAGVQGNRITAMTQDSRGRIFVASEENGLWMRSGRRGDWTRFKADGNIKSDMIYALTVDKQNRVWAGTARHGISVYNGRSWKNFDVLKAPLGERIFSIAVNPLDGDVWIASNVGLTRYSQKNDKWATTYPTATLPFSHLQALAFNARGVLFAGTQTQGVLISQPQKTSVQSTNKGTNIQIEYSKWRHVTSPAVVPDVANGVGLPSDMISDVLVARDQTVYLATTTGLAWSKNEGATWQYKRGADFVEKARQRLIPVKLPDAVPADNVLSEDYVSCLAEDESGHLWIGHWRRGYEVLDPKTHGLVLNGDKGDDPNSNDPGDYVKCLLAIDGQATLIGCYGIGLTVAPKLFPATKIETDKAQSSTRKSASTSALPVSSTDSFDVPFPSVQSAPTLAELNTLLKQLGAVPVQADSNALNVVALDDDWSTRGDWLGRYGRYWAECCAMFAPSDYIWGAGEEPINYFPRIGLNVPKSEGLRTYVTAMYSDNPNSLEIPATFLDTRIRRGYTTKNRGRRQSEIDDRGEGYPYQKDGPHLYTSLQIPQGVWTLSLYNWNKDGDTWDNRKRDYRIAIRPHDSEKPLSDISSFASQPELANARLRDFRSGAWKRFLVRGPQELTIEVNKNYSLNTILAGLMLDKLDEKPAPYFSTSDGNRVLDVRLSPKNSETVVTTKLFNQLDGLQSSNPIWWAQSSRRFYLPLTLWLRAQQQIARDTDAPIAEKKTLATQLATCYYNLHLFELWEAQQRKAGLTPARDIEKALTWDSVSRGWGDGYNVVTKYLAAQKQDSSSGSAKALSINTPSNPNTR